MKKINVIIPLAGKGSRFTEEKYTFPKPLIDVNGNPMISVVIKNLTDVSRDMNFIFICQREHYKQYDLNGIFKNSVNKNHTYEVIQIDSITEGAACTALLAKKYIDSNDELMVANSDQFVEKISMNNWWNRIDISKSDGLIMTFKSTHSKWSYARTDENACVIEVAEKKVISQNASTGLYWWRHGSDFVSSVEKMIEKDIRFNNEFYIAPTYNEMILDEKEIKLVEIPYERFHGLGTPEDLEKFLSLNKK